MGAALPRQALALEECEREIARGSEPRRRGASLESCAGIGSRNEDRTMEIVIDVRRH